MKDLKELYLRDTAVTDDGVKAARKALPGCKFIR